MHASNVKVGGGAFKLDGKRNQREEDDTASWFAVVVFVWMFVRNCGCSKLKERRRKSLHLPLAKNSSLGGDFFFFFFLWCYLNRYIIMAVLLMCPMSSCVRDDSVPLLLLLHQTVESRRKSRSAVRALSELPRLQLRLEDVVCDICRIKQGNLGRLLHAGGSPNKSKIPRMRPKKKKKIR